MQTRQCFFWLTLCVVLLTAVLLLFFATRSKEPKYEGKTAAAWFQQFHKGKPSYLRNSGIARMVLPGGGFSNIVFQSVDEGSFFHDRATTALQALGTNSALYLVRFIARAESPLATHYRNLYRKTWTSFQRMLPQPSDPALRVDACLALKALGTNSSLAIPILIDGLHNPDQSCRFDCRYALSLLQFNPHDVDPTLRELCRQGKLKEAFMTVAALTLRTSTAAAVLGDSLSDTNILTRRDAAVRLRNFGPEAEAVAPKLAAALNDTDSDVRHDAAYALESLGPSASAAVPDLIKALQGQDQELRYLSARALCSIGTNAAAAEPALIRATNDTHEPVRHAATRALQRVRD
jgi:hypothetical protein